MACFMKNWSGAGAWSLPWNKRSHICLKGLSTFEKNNTRKRGTGIII
jgi:hypothetical protein